jgi:23S rRNA pseudouridine2457 synthase
MKNFKYYQIYKPFGYLSQFSGEDTDLLLGQLGDFPKDVYPVGRLDKDSEGLLLLTNDNQLKTKLLNPENYHQKTYWAQLEGDITTDAIDLLANGSITIKHNQRDYKVKQAICKKIHPTELPERFPPIRFRANIPTSWIELTLYEGKNRQVRKMTSAVGFPTLRLIRVGIGSLKVDFKNQKTKELKRADFLLAFN